MTIENRSKITLILILHLKKILLLNIWVVAEVSYAVELEKGLYMVNIKDPGLIIIAGFNDYISKCVRDNKYVIPWLITQCHAGAEIASLCIGDFLLTATGLLDGKKCSTY